MALRAPVCVEDVQPGQMQLVLPPLRVVPVQSLPTIRSLQTGRLLADWHRSHSGPHHIKCGQHVLDDQLAMRGLAVVLLLHGARAGAQVICASLALDHQLHPAG